jgi:L-ascorbate metabolism protein UlaG (beta-lactamase superfamily)
MLNGSIFDRLPTLGWKLAQGATYADGRFHNTQPTRMLGSGGGLRVLWRMLTAKSSEAKPRAPFEVLRLTPADLAAAPDGSLWRLGHSTLLMKLEGKFWITDPVFAQRASPFLFAGPKRFHAPPIAREDLPEIEAVILSHDHYDHLDYHTVLALAPRVQHFITTLGVGDRLISWGIPAEKVRQLDWWQETAVGGVRFVATPAQHFSGRGLSDHNATLWASWVVITPALRVFFSGDGGYFEGFREIGERFGPFDVACIENGAYDHDWPDVHMQPEQTLQAHLDLRARHLLPIHNGTFDLALHAWTEPFERLTALAAQHGVAMCTPRIGECVALADPASGTAWWRVRVEIPAPRHCFLCRRSTLQG